jgi:chaperonin GroEL
MAVKQLAFDQQAQKAILAGVEKLASAVKSTYGPRGRNAVLDKGWGGPTVTKDGVTSPRRSSSTTSTRTWAPSS